MSISELISPLVGRVALAWFFVTEAWARAHAWHDTVALLRDAHAPAPPVLLVLALVLMFLGSASLVLGWHARHGAILLFAVMTAVTLGLHAYWKIPDEAARLAEYEIFARNIAVAGGLLMIVGLGPGPLAIDKTGGKGR